MFTNLFMLATRTSVEDCVTFFVAFHVLTAVDNIYAEGLANFSLKEAVEEPLQWSRHTMEWKSRSAVHKSIRVVYLVLIFLYNSVYYYYLPFMVNIIPYTRAGNYETQAEH